MSQPCCGGPTRDPFGPPSISHAREQIRTRSEWFGERLLDSLIDGIVTAPYRELCVHALWALLRQRGHLLKQPEVALRASVATRRALDGTELEESSRRRLEQVNYLAESVS